MASKLKPTKTTGLSTGLVKKGLTKDQLSVLELFCYLIYQSSDHEITAKTTETYAIIKKRLGSHKPNTLIKFEDEEEEELVTKLIKDSYGWQVSKLMTEYDIFQEFQKLDQDVTIKFFSYIKDFDKFIHLHTKGWDRFVEIVKTIGKLVYMHNTKKVKLLSDDEVINLMKNYGDYINNQGFKLKKKVGKLYAHFI